MQNQDLAALFCTELSDEAPMNQASNSLCMHCSLHWNMFTAMGEAAHDQHKVIVMADS